MRDEKGKRGLGDGFLPLALAGVVVAFQRNDVDVAGLLRLVLCGGRGKAVKNGKRKER